VNLPPEQLGFDLTPGGGGEGKPSGYDRWQTERRQALAEAARKLGLPLGHRAEVILRGGVRLVGDLRLAEDTLWVEARRDFHVLLRIERCTFTAAEVESCVRLD